MDLFDYVGDRIRDLRTTYGGEEGISQEALGKALGVAANTVSRWETAKNHPSLEDLERLAQFFGASILNILLAAFANIDRRRLKPPPDAFARSVVAKRDDE